MVSLLYSENGSVWRCMGYCSIMDLRLLEVILFFWWSFDRGCLYESNSYDAVLRTMIDTFGAVVSICVSLYLHEPINTVIRKIGDIKWYNDMNILPSLKLNTSPENRPGPKMKRSYSNHPFSGAMPVSFRECISLMQWIPPSQLARWCLERSHEWSFGLWVV